RADPRGVRACWWNPARHVLLEDVAQRREVIEVPPEGGVGVSGEVGREVGHGAVDIARGLGLEEALESRSERSRSCFTDQADHGSSPSFARCCRAIEDICEGPAWRYSVVAIGRRHQCRMVRHWMLQNCGGLRWSSQRFVE